MTALLWLEKTFLYIMIYAFAGWVYETVICSLEARRLVERGFFNGPYCPIYGFGAMLDVYALGWTDNIFRPTSWRFCSTRGGGTIPHTAST